MKKLMLIVALLVSLGLVAGVFAEPASAFLFKSGSSCGSFWGAKAFGPAWGAPYAPYYCAPYYYGCAPYVCKPRKAKGKAAAAPAKAPAVKKTK